MNDHEHTGYKGSKNPFVAWVNADPAPEKTPRPEINCCKISNDVTQ